MGRVFFFWHNYYVVETKRLEVSKLDFFFGLKEDIMKKKRNMKEDKSPPRTTKKFTEEMKQKKKHVSSKSFLSLSKFMKLSPVKTICGEVCYILLMLHYNPECRAHCQWILQYFHEIGNYILFS